MEHFSFLVAYIYISISKTKKIKKRFIISN